MPAPPPRRAASFQKFQIKSNGAALIPSTYKILLVCESATNAQSSVGTDLEYYVYAVSV